MKKKIIIGAIISLFILLILFFVIFFSCLCGEEKNNITNVNEYEKYFGKKGIYRTEYMINDVFPTSIEHYNCEKINYYYLNKFDSCYCGYMVLKFNEKEYYSAEYNRLKTIGVQNYKDVRNDFDLIAYKKSGFGVIYALNLSNSRIAYIDVRYSDGINDLDYKKIIPKEFLALYRY